MTAGRPAPESGMLAIYDTVRTLILKGELAPGVPLSQVKLASRLGVSRTPLREALRLLEREDLVVAAPRRRVAVARLTAESCEHIYVQRILLESFATRQTVGTLSTADLEALDARLQRMHDLAHAFDFDGWEVQHRGFHNLLYTGVGEHLNSVISRLSDHAERYRRAYLTLPRTIPLAEEEHRGLLAAARANDSDLGGRRMAEHLARTAQAVIRQLDPAWPLDRLHAVVRMAGGNPHCL